MPVEHHEHHARECQRRACDLPPRHPFAAVGEAHRHGRPHGRRADDQRDVRGRGVLQSDVLGQEIERPSAQPAAASSSFVAQVRGPQPAAGASGRMQTYANAKRRRKISAGVSRVGDQHLGRNERRAPYGDGEQRREVVFVFRIILSYGSKNTRFF